MQTQPESILGAITSNELRKELYIATRNVNPVAGLLFVHIIKTGMYLKDALSMTVKEMLCYIASDNCAFSEEEIALFQKQCDSLTPNEHFYTYEGKTLTISAIRVIWDKASENKPPYRITSTALRKTYFWDLYIKTPKKNRIMRKLQLYSIEEVAEYFDVPLEAVTASPSIKATAMSSKDNIMKVLADTESNIHQIESMMNDSLLPDEEFSKVLQYINTLDLANSLFN